MKRIVQDKQLDYSDQQIYVGIDVHQKSWKVSVATKDVLFKAYSQEPDVEVLYNHLTSRYPGGDYICVYEAGFSGFWLQECLAAKGIMCKLVHPGDVPTTEKEKRFKTDKRDSRKLARGLRGGELEYINIPSKQLQQDRARVRTRYKIKRDLCRVQNRIVSYIHFMGLEEPIKNQRWSKKYLIWIREIPKTTGHKALELLLEEYDLLRIMEKKALNSLKELSQTSRLKEDIELLETVPGIALLTALRLRVEIGDIKRFKNLDKLSSMVGLIPTTDSSGENQRVGEMTKRGRSELRTALVESAWVAIRMDPELGLSYQIFRKRMTAQKAIIKIARKLLNRVRRVLITKQKYIIASI